MASNKTSVAKLVYPPEVSGSNTLSDFYQGVSITLMDELIGPATPKFRPNNDYLKIKGGIRTIALEGPFDDLESPVSLSSLSGSQVTLDYTSKLQNTGSGLLSGYNIAPSSYRLEYDFGQTDIYQDGQAYNEVDSFQGISGSLIIIKSNDPSSIIVPFSIVNASDEENIDGTIEPQDVRRYIDRTTEVPFHIRGTWGYIGSPDSYRRCVLIEQQYETIASRLIDGGGIFGTDPFLDGQQNIGSGSNALESETLEYIHEPDAVIEPFIDTTDGVLTSLQVSGSVDFLDVIISRMVSGSNLPGSDYLRKDHVSLSRGFDYDNSEFGFDSVAFGGLLK